MVEASRPDLAQVSLLYPTDETARKDLAVGNVGRRVIKVDDDSDGIPCHGAHVSSADALVNVGRHEHRSDDGAWVHGHIITRRSLVLQRERPRNIHQ